MQLRDYQKAAVKAVEAEWGMGRKKTMLVLPTGGGKTVVFSAIAQRRVNAGGRVLVLAHRDELLAQAADKLARVTGLPCNFERGVQSEWRNSPRVTVGSVQTLMQDKRLNAIPADYYNTVIVDEAHHCVSDSYQKVLGHFESADLLGVTATPSRSDRRSLGKFFDSLAYEYTMRQAVKEGHLVPIKAQMIPLEIDLSKVRMTSGDYSAADCGTALDPYLDDIADNIARRCVGRKTVVFLPLIATSKKLCAMLKVYGVSAAEVNGDSKDRAEILADFEAGKYDVLCNSMLLTEGWDCPSVDCVVVLRPTKSRALYQQMVGRGMRLSPETGKRDLLLLDFLWMTERHDLCKPVNLFGNSEAVEKKMQDKLKAMDKWEQLDLLEAESEAERDVAAEREQALAAELEALRKKKARLVDPLEFSISIADCDLQDWEPVYKWQSEPMTDKQALALERMGINPQAVQTKGKAAEILNRLTTRAQLGLTTPKQIRMLENRGFRNVASWTKAEAIEITNRIARNNWRLPRDLDPGRYIPPSIQNQWGGAQNAMNWR